MVWKIVDLGQSRSIAEEVWTAKKIVMIEAYTVRGGGGNQKFPELLKKII